MKYDFDEIVPRRGTHSVKWELDSDPDILPMWVADMDFRTAPPVVEALRRRVEHGIFGYAQAPQAYYDAVVKWFERRHGWHTEPEWILHTTGVIPALSAILKALTQPGDKILVQTPVYNHFFISIRNSGCRTAENDLTYRGGAYTIDFADLERKAADPEVKAMLLCNPHNPAGRVWSPEELRRIGEICLRNGVFVVADEIHCELVMPGFRYTPFASLGEEFLHNSVTCCSPSKAFNLAGLQVANIIAAGETVRAKIEKALRINETGEIGPLAIDALIAAYDRGAEWLDAQLTQRTANMTIMVDKSEHALRGMVAQGTGDSGDRSQRRPDTLDRLHQRHVGEGRGGKRETEDAEPRHAVGFDPDAARQQAAEDKIERPPAP